MDTRAAEVREEKEALIIVGEYAHHLINSGRLWFKTRAFRRWLTFVVELSGLETPMSHTSRQGCWGRGRTEGGRLTLDVNVAIPPTGRSWAEYREEGERGSKLNTSAHLRASGLRTQGELASFSPDIIPAALVWFLLPWLNTDRI